MRRPIWESPAFPRICVVRVLLIATVVSLAWVAWRIEMVTGIRMTLETESAAAVDGRVFWRNGTNAPYAAAQSVPIRVPAGRGCVTAFLPTGGRIRGLRVEAPGVSCGVIGLLGGNGLLRADSPGDLEFSTSLFPRRFPRLKSTKENEGKAR